MSSGISKWSAGMVLSKYNFSLCYAKLAAETPTSVLLLLQMSPQKRLGSYFNISGVDCANSYFACIHTLWNALVAVTTLSSLFPYNRLVSARWDLACRHSSVYQGASVLPHLLGFLGMVIWTCLTTYARTACYSIYDSTAAALSSFEIVLSSINVCKPVRNSGLLVYSFHALAECA